MIIYGKQDIPIRKSSEPITALYKFPVSQTREDYRTLTGKEPPPPNPMLRRKHWFDPQYSLMTGDDGEEVIYLVLAIDPATNRPRLNKDGKPYLTYTSMPTYIAGQVNIPQGLANEFPSDSPIMRFSHHPPVRPLHDDEELVLSSGPMGSVMVINKTLQTGSVSDWIRQIRELLDKIESRIGG